MIRLAPGSLVSRRLQERPGELPGPLFVHGGQPPTSLSALVFSPEGAQEQRLDGLDDLDALLASGMPCWLRLQGQADAALVSEVLARVGVPGLLHAPLIDTPQRTRLDAVEDVVLVVMHRLSFSRTPARLISEQVGLLLMPNLLLSLEEAPKPEAFPRLSRWLLGLRPPPGQEDLDDLLHFLIDELLDELFPMLEDLADLLDDMEEAALRNPRPSLLNRTYQVRATLRQIRSQVWPLRPQIMILLRQNHRLLGGEALSGFQDMDQQVALIFEHVELLRHQCDAVTDAYMASMGSRMNQVMKTLTIVSTIFAPLTFVAGIYGMNFVRMPELKWAFGYPMVLAFMALIAMLQSYWLWRRGWFEDWTAQRSWPSQRGGPERGGGLGR